MEGRFSILMFLSYSFFRLKDFVTRRSTVVSKVNPMTCHGFYQTLVEVQKKKKYNLTVFLRKDKSLNYLFSTASPGLVRFCIVRNFYKPHYSRTYSIFLIYRRNWYLLLLQNCKENITLEIIRSAKYM